MERIPFSVYDFFGYLAAGFLLMAAGVAAFVGEEPLHDNPSIAVGILLVIIAYILGQVLANLSGYLFEAILLDKLIGRPTDHLFASELGPMSRLFPGYYRPLPKTTQARVLERAERASGIDSPGPALFFHCHALVKKEEVANERMNTFLNLYGFCRNSCMALLVATPLLAIGTALGSAETGVVGPGWWLLGGALGAIGLFYRYLKFFRLYAVEVFVSYAELA
jgi:hypothetical protein